MTVFEKPKSLTDAELHYCPGCTHGIIHRLVAEAIDALGIEGKTIGVAPVGCAVMAYNYFACDMVEAAHGRAPAVATGLKRSMPENIIFTYQGDGDLASIGMAETVHAATRNENITVIFVNNAIYGMTGGQMAPTSLPGQVTQTSPYGRDVKTAGYPIKVCEMLSTLDAPEYIERVAVNNVKNIRTAKKAIEKAFRNQVEKKGFSLIEVISSCPTNWGMTPQRTRAQRRVTDMTTNILLAGFGGQGILFAGKFLAYKALTEGRELSWLPSYGPEMRGGTANCSVILSDEPIGSPIVSEPDVLVAMNLPSLDKYEDSVVPGGSIFADSTLIERKVKRNDVKVFYVPSTSLAQQIGAPTLANMIMVGKLIKETGAVSYDNLEEALKKVVSSRHRDLFDINLRAINKGYEL